jgi:hypothetical protein
VTNPSRRSLPTDLVYVIAPIMELFSQTLMTFAVVVAAASAVAR